MPVSKSRRTPRRKAASGSPAPVRSLPAHAHLTDAGGHVLGGIALRDDEWLLVLQGKPAATTDSAGMAMAMLRHTAVLLAQAGRPVEASCSHVLQSRAADEAAEAGQTLEEYLTYLEAERVARDHRAGASLQ